MRKDDKDQYIKMIDGERDHRQHKGAWAPGYYSHSCHKCKTEFLGDKRAMICADCAYESEAQ